ncbi:non-hydrolyzing UDP-N-acetylglucosamine 2-epimerase [Glaciimonas sp. PCH181]|uniref:non-hydrolyzing UDP-N-acetylglucosamine 2-epimerase n=1 Tax=Glaciimonas sp. PCH181 TaxID=2133943 RepID=UPI000D3958C0|nr:UDP-N-acetylglucosamine 2-epimerase (non-hydrolyzing) [Glaciimonas sp. PCH181]PUA18823.1 UDP-N-acetylglucosamine 2-epimerase (non-hydrolyzing) [Glaciimonas sp. PCH181]
MNPSILLCMGTRPEIIKMAPVYRALKASALPVKLLHTGQHKEMAWPLYKFFDMLPDYFLKLERTSGSLAHLNGLLLEEIDAVLQQISPAAVLVHGDTSSALAATLAAFYHQIAVGHVEAGLRSGAMYDPFPEEKNRELIGRIAHWHFAPTPIAESSLLREGLDSKHIYCVGNTIVDATLWGMNYIDKLPDQGLTSLPPSLKNLPAILPERRLLLVTAHRRENWEKGIASIATAVREALENDEGLCAVWPVHMNPIVQEAVHHVFADVCPGVAKRLFLTEPLNYPALLWIMKRAWLILTDSGGIQEEAMVMRVPVFVLRDTTERPELIAAGGGIMVGTNAAVIGEKMAWLHADGVSRKKMCDVKNPFGDGHAADHIRDILLQSIAPRQPQEMAHADAVMQERAA